LVLSDWVWAGNQETAQRIAANLQRSGELQAYRIGIRVEDSTATLEGTVTDLRQMNAALRIAASTPGVKRVINRLSLGSAPAEAANSTPEAHPRLLSTQAPMQASPAAAFGPQVIHTVADEPKGSPVAPAVPSSMIRQDSAAKPLQRIDAAEPVALAPHQEVAPTAPAGQVVLVPVAVAAGNQPIPIAYLQPAPGGAAPMPQYVSPVAAGAAPMTYNQPYLPNYAWPSYAAYPNYAALTYPRQYSPTAWPYIGPFYPYPQVPLGWRKVSLEWHDGWWFLDFDDGSRSKGLISGLLRPRQ